MLPRFALIPLTVALVAMGRAQTPVVEDVLEARQLGPTTMSGRIMDIAVYEKDPRIFYVATASGGLWKTENGGTLFEPIFEKQSSVSMGCVAVSATNPDVIYVGTGEQSSRNSVAWGDGVYKSTDGGKSWTNLGLRESRHIGALWVNPRDDNHVRVGALGPLWSPGGERGLYESRDGGKTWTHLLKTTDDAGVIDLEVDPRNPNVMLASLWQRRRWAYDFVSGGPGSRLMKSTDGGKTWRRIMRGIPATTLGKIGIDVLRSDPRRMVATFEYRPPVDEKRPADRGLVARAGGGTFVSKDGGESWTKVNNLNPRPFYFSKPRIDQSDPERFWLLSDNLYSTKDGGKTLTPQATTAHPDWHAWWQSPADPNHIIGGNDGGVYVTRDKGKSWIHVQDLPLGQFYAVAVDMRRPYWILGGLQDNQCWMMPTQTADGGPGYDSTVNLGGGDGFYVAADPEDPRAVYSESQGGAIVRTDLKTGESRFIQPRAVGTEKLRFNWSTPFMLSPHNPKTLLLGANKLFKSINRGDTWKAISPDLTTNDPEKLKPGEKSVTPENTGAERHCTITTLSESPRQAGVIWVGTDDGKVQLTKDDGATWTDLTGKFPGLPAFTWCSRVEASRHVDGRAYATFDGHRNGDLGQYLYVTEDFGATWTRLGADWPADDSLYVVREGLKNPDLLFLGSEMRLRVSLDRGKTWQNLADNFPRVATHDLVIHPREGDLVIGTHGRSIWTVDINGLEGLSEAARKSDLVVMAPQDVLILGRVDRGGWAGDKPFSARNSQPGTRIQYWLAKEAKDVEVQVVNAKGEKTTFFGTATKKAGLNVIPWNGRIGSNRLTPGEYTVIVTADGKTERSTVKVVEAYLFKD